MFLGNSLSFDLFFMFVHYIHLFLLSIYVWWWPIYLRFWKKREENFPMYRGTIPRGTIRLPEVYHVARRNINAVKSTSTKIALNFFPLNGQFNGFPLKEKNVSLVRTLTWYLLFRRHNHIRQPFRIVPTRRPLMANKNQNAAKYLHYPFNFLLFVWF